MLEIRLESSYSTLPFLTVGIYYLQMITNMIGHAAAGRGKNKVNICDQLVKPIEAKGQ